MTAKGGPNCFLPAKPTLQAPQRAPVCCAEFVESSAARISRLIFDTLPVYGNLGSQRAVLATLRTALCNETFMRTFAATLLRTDGEHVSRRESFILFMWSCAVLQALQWPAAAKAAQKLMERQVRLSLSTYTWQREACKQSVLACACT